MGPTRPNRQVSRKPALTNHLLPYLDHRLYEAAVDDEVRPRHVAGERRRQEHRQGGHLFGRRQTPRGEATDARKDVLARGVRIDAGRPGHSMRDAVLTEP